MDRRCMLTGLLAGVLSGPTARAQALAGRPVTIVIPFAPGGASDVVVRALSETLERQFDRPFVPENKGGAGGLIAAAAVGRAAPDGQTLLYGNQGQIVVAPHLFPASGTQPRTALEPVTQTARTSFFLTVAANAPAGSVRELADAARRAPLRFGVPGLGSPPHLATVLLAEAWRLPIEVVPYQGSAPLLVDLIAGRLDGAFDNVASSLQHLRAGKLRALGVSSARRAAIAPEIATLAEAGVAGYAYQSWQGLFVPRGTPAELVARLDQGVRRALEEPPVRRRVEDLGLEIAAEGPAAFEALIAQDARQWEALARRGILRAG